MDREEIAAQQIIYALENTKELQNTLGDKTLTDYQYFTSRVFLGLKTLSSLLVFWDTGYGKTLLGIHIMKNITFNYPSWRIFLFIKASIHEVWEEELKKYNINAFIFHYKDINVFTKFKSKLENYKNKKDRVLIIIDEVHNLVSMNKDKKFSNKERKINRLFKLIRNITEEKFNKLLVMSATPIVNDIQEFNLLLDLLRKNKFTFDDRYFDPREKLLNIDQLKNGLLLLTSYKKENLDSLSNTLLSDNFAKKTVYIKNIEMSDYQESFFNEASKYEYMSKDLYRLKTIRRLVSTFVFNGLKLKKDITEEEYNIMINDKLNSFKKFVEKIKFDDTLIDNFKNNIDITDEKFLTLRNYSCKYIETCKIILNSKGKCLIYEPFVSFEGIATLREYLKLFNITFIEYSTMTNYREKNLKDFNKIENINGDVIKCCIFSNAGNEGISFTCINDLIILDIPWSESLLRQIIGRSVRFKSHLALDIERRYVDVHILISMTKKGKSSDREMFNLINRKLNRINQIYTVLKETSIEYVYEKHKNLEPEYDEYFINDLERKKIDFKDEVLKYKVREVIRIKYKMLDLVEEGYLDKSNIVYDKDMNIVGKLKEDENGLDFYIENDNLIYYLD